MTYSFHPDAESELMEAFAFYRAEGGDAIARVFLKEVGRFPYSLIYRATVDGIRILVVAHQHRRHRLLAGPEVARGGRSCNGA